jgi:DNA ligase (NAD+)
MLWDLGFRSPDKEKKLFKGIGKVIEYCLKYEEGRDQEITW